MNENEKDKDIDKWIQQVLKVEQTLPEGLSDRLEQQIDIWAQIEKKKKMPIFSHQNIRYVWSGIAATLLLGFGLFQYAESNRSNGQIADTFSNPQEAEIVAEKALLLLSQNLNKGIKQMKQADIEIAQINQRINNHLK